MSERGAGAPSLSSVCGRGRQGVEASTTHVSAQDIEEISHHQCADPGIDSPRQVPIRESSVWDLWKGFTPRTGKRTRVDVIKNTHLKPSWHPTGTTPVTRPKPECGLHCQRIPSEPPRARSFKTSDRKHFPTKRNPVACPCNGSGLPLTDPVRGLTRPSIPPPFHWREEKCSHTFPPRSMDFFSSNILHWTFHTFATLHFVTINTLRVSCRDTPSFDTPLVTG
jgi:hypothetical protein